MGKFDTGYQRRRESTNGLLGMLSLTWAFMFAMAGGLILLLGPGTKQSPHQPQAGIHVAAKDAPSEIRCQIEGESKDIGGGMGQVSCLFDGGAIRHIQFPKAVFPQPRQGQRAVVLVCVQAPTRPDEISSLYILAKLE